MRPRVRDLMAAELSRFAHRRAIRNSLFGVLVVYVVAVISMFVYFAPAPAAAVEAARATLAQTVSDSVDGYDQCSAVLPAGHDVLQDCGPAPADQNFGDVTQYFSVKPFLLGVSLPGLAGLLGLVFAAVAFLVGAIWMGAEWTTGSFAMLSTWEPSRVRLLTVKALALTVSVLATAVGLQVVWLLTSFALARSRGTDAPDPVAWSQLLGVQSRAVVVGLLAALAGFALANLFRGVAGVLGLALGYALVVEGAVRWLSPSSSAWFVSENVQGLLQRHRVVITWDSAGQVLVTSVSHLHAGLVLTAGVAALLFVGACVVHRSDLS